MAKSADLLPKLLWQGQNRLQLAGAAVGAFIGLLLLLGAAQLYADFQAARASRAGQDQAFLQINKKINLLHTLAGQSGFTSRELEELRGMKGVKSLGVFASNNFRVQAASDRLGFRTELFLESLPDAFLDVPLYAFRWEEGQQELPLIISRDYLALYNFGFAPSQGLPQLSQGTVQQARFEILLGDRFNRRVFKGRIVGFSDRINSILVPQAFLEWANRLYAGEEEKPPARVILEVENPQDPGWKKLFTQKGYEMSAGRVVGEQAAVVLRLLAVAIWIVGLLVAVLSGLVLVLNFSLLASRSAAEIRLLLELGYRREQIRALLHQKLSRLFGLVAGLALATLCLAQVFIRMWLEGQGYRVSWLLHPLIWIFAIAVIVGFWFWSRRALGRGIAPS